VACGRQFIQARFWAEGKPCLHHYRGSFYSWRNTHFRERDDDYIRAELYEFLHKALTQNKAGNVVPFNPTTDKVNKIFDAIRAGCHLDAEQEAPCWLLGESEHPAPEQLIACRNGLLDITTRELSPHSPFFFNMNALEFDYQADAPRPERWGRFLEELWPEDEAARLTLQEIFGLLLTGDTSFQKIFMLVGPKRSGKGTIGHVLKMLLGKDNVVAPTMASLGTDNEFVLWPVIDKRLAIVPDARLAPGRGGSRAVERLLSISGEDPQTIDRKHKTAWTGKLDARFVILTNELPRLPDASGALASRFITLTLQHSFYGKEDRGLKEKLRSELPGILNWALEGLRRLQERGRFDPPSSSLDTFQYMEDLSSPVGAFVRDKCEVRADARIEKADLYDAYKRYCEAQGDKHPYTQLMFGRNLTAAYPSVRVGHSGATKFYYGIRLKLRKQEEEDEEDDDAYNPNRSYRTRRWTRGASRHPDAEDDEGEEEVTD
jgi:putative DNA primase/helicase